MPKRVEIKADHSRALVMKEGRVVCGLEVSVKRHRHNFEYWWANNGQKYLDEMRGKVEDDFNKWIKGE